MTAIVPASTTTPRSTSDDIRRPISAPTMLEMTIYSGGHRQLVLAPAAVRGPGRIP
jgi:hypothetical protein